MSPEMGKQRENQPSRSRSGEGRREESGQQPETPQRSRGIHVGGMLGSDLGISKEISCRDLNRSTLSASPQGKTDAVAREVGVLNSSVDLWESITHGEPREDTCSRTQKRREGHGDGSAEIKTPDKVRHLQITLYRKAKAEPEYRFWSLYGELLRLDVLEQAWKRVASNGGAAGVDGVSIQGVKTAAGGVRQWLQALREELSTKRYRPQAVRRVYIPKSNGDKRPLGIPTVKDRVVQMATYLMLMPIFEADFHPNSYGFRPKRRAQQALEAIRRGLYTGRTEVVDTDLSKYFDTIPHKQLLRRVAKRVSDGSILRLIKQWLKAPIVEEEKETKRVVPNTCGTPQGGVISPLLANLYLNPLDHAVNQSAGRHPPILIRYADDSVILCWRGQGGELKKRLERWLSVRGIKLNTEKTRIVNSRKESFDFLGFTINWRNSANKKKLYVHIEPSQKSQKAMRERMRGLFHHFTEHYKTQQTITEANPMIRGWGEYFRYGNCGRVMEKMRRNINRRVQHWLWRKHHCKGNKQTQFDFTKLEQHYGLYQLSTKAPWKERKTSA